MRKRSTENGEKSLLLTKANPRQPARNQVYSILKNAIVSTQIRPGEMLSEHRICNAIGVSRTPVRDAIGRLAEEGLIEVFPQRGSIVAPISLSRVYEGHFVRRTLELAVLREAAKRWSTEASEKSRNIIAAQRRARKPAEILLFDDQYHMHFCEVAGLPNVWATIQAAKCHLDRVRHLAVPVPGNKRAVVSEHANVVAALDQGDTRSAIRLLREHLDSVYKTIERLAQNREGVFVDR